MRLQVSDTGHGMSKEVLDLAFDPFFTTKPIGQGTGLGLSMIYGYMRQSGGAVALESEVGRGTCVSLYFPRSSEQVSGEAPAGLDSAEAGKRPDSVLVVEDDATVREFVCELLRDLGFQVMSARTGAEGMAMLSGAIHFDLLVSDVGLPGPNGRQVADFARERLPGILVLLMTGYAEQAAMDPGFLSTHRMEAHRQALRCPGAGSEGAGHGGHARSLNALAGETPGSPRNPLRRQDGPGVAQSPPS